MTPAATNCTACWDEPHWRSTVVAGTRHGSPAAIHALRVTLVPCSPDWVMHPPTTSSTTAGSTSLRSSRCFNVYPSRSVGCHCASAPLRFPNAVRIVSTMTAWRISDIPDIVVRLTLQSGSVEHPFDAQQQLLAVHPARVATEPTAGAKDAMAGDDDRDRVGAERVACGTRAVGAAGGRRDLPVRRDPAEGDLRRGPKDAAPEAGRERPVDPGAEPTATAGEVLVEVAADLGEPGGCFEDPGRDPGGQVVEHVVGTFVRVGQSHEARRCERHQQWAERRVDARVGHVEQALGLRPLDERARVGARDGPAGAQTVGEIVHGLPL